MSLKENRSWHFLVGCFVLLCVWKLFQAGVFDWFFRDETEGYESLGSLIPLAITAVVSAVQMVGLLALALVAGAAPLAENLVDFLRAKMPHFDKTAQVIEEKVDADKLVKTLNSLDERLRSIEVKFGDDQ